MLFIQHQYTHSNSAVSEILIYTQTNTDILLILCDDLNFTLKTFVMGQSHLNRTNLQKNVYSSFEKILFTNILCSLHCKTTKFDTAKRLRYLLGEDKKRIK